MFRSFNRPLVILVAALPFAIGACAQMRSGGDGAGPPSFFVTSAGTGKGADLGGLQGADRHCQALASTAGLPGSKTWRAYLSTQGKDGAATVDARDRIGKGPWHNVKGELIARDVAHLHSATT